jgi:hypothetical protein
MKNRRGASASLIIALGLLSSPGFGQEPAGNSDVPHRGRGDHR